MQIRRALAVFPESIGVVILNLQVYNESSHGSCPRRRFVQIYPTLTQEE